MQPGWSSEIGEAGMQLVRRDLCGCFVPASVWTEPGTKPKAVVLIGHGGSQHRLAPSVKSVARAVLDKIPAYVLAIDGPVHGDRQPSSVEDTRKGFVSLWLTADGGVPAMASDWSVALHALKVLGGDETLPLAYYGVSMGTAFGLPFLAGVPQVAAAAIGMWADEVGGRSHLAVAAQKLHCPVLFFHREQDEFFDALGARRLFDRIAAANKRFVSLPGPHAETPDQIEMAAEFLADRLTLVAGDA